MELITPDFGLIFWQLIVFGILFFLLAKFAWKPIIQSLAEREQSIDEAIKLSETTRAEMAELKAGNEQLISSARAEVINCSLPAFNSAISARVVSDNLIASSIDCSRSAND